jgi:acyl-CoA thioesterase-1
VLHFNWGLHDLKVTPEGGRQVPIDTYEKNLASLVTRLNATGARLIWATTTPVPEGKHSPPREPSDVPRYNAVALKVMDLNHVATDDLYAAALPRLAEIQIPLNVHFNNSGWEVLGGQVAAAIAGALKPEQR